MQRRSRRFEPAAGADDGAGMDVAVLSDDGAIGDRRSRQRRSIPVPVRRVEEMTARWSIPRSAATVSGRKWSMTWMNAALGLRDGDQRSNGCTARPLPSGAPGVTRTAPAWQARSLATFLGSSRYVGCSGWAFWSRATSWSRRSAAREP